MTAPSKPVLVADIGGTNARFALADVDASVPLLDDTSREFAVVDFGSLGEACSTTSTRLGCRLPRACSPWLAAWMATRRASPTTRG